MVLQLTAPIERHWDVRVFEHAVVALFGTLPCTQMHENVIKETVEIDEIERPNRHAQSTSNSNSWGAIMSVLCRALYCAGLPPSALPCS